MPFGAQVFGADITSNTDRPMHSLGSIFTTGGKTYVYVQLYASAAAAGAAGRVLYHTATPYVATDDVSTITSVNDIIGVCHSTITLGYYGWVQTWGDRDDVKKSITDSTNAIASGDTIIGNVTADASCAHVAAGTAPTYKPLGVCTAIAPWTTSTVAIYINIGPRV